MEEIAEPVIIPGPASDPAPKIISVPEARSLLPIDYSDLSLNPRELKAVALYCTNGFDQVAAAQAAGYRYTRKEFEKGVACEFLKRPEVIEAIRRFVAHSLSPFQARFDYELIDRYYRRATYLISTFVNDDGTAKPLSSIEIEWQQCIDGMTTKNIIVEGKATKVIEYLLPNRDTALQTIAKLIQATKDTDRPAELPTESRDRIASIYQDIYKQVSAGQPPVNFNIQVNNYAPKRGRGRPKKTMGIPLKSPIETIEAARIPVSGAKKR